MQLIQTISAIMTGAASFAIGYSVLTSSELANPAQPARKMLTGSAIDIRQAPSLSPQLIWSASNASYLLGWEIAGLMDTKEHLQKHCANIVSEAGGRWGQIGLPAKFVQSAYIRHGLVA